MPVGMIYRWEDHNHGLEHKCGTCATVLSSPRAKKTCFGIHEEVCPAYHKTLHFVGASHRCAACTNTVEAHDKRHLEIARMIAAIRRLEGRSSTESPLCNNKRKGKLRKESNPDPSDDGVHIGEVNEQREVKSDCTSSTLNDNNDDDAKERKQCWSGTMESPDARKAAKAERKAAKNQVLFDIITPAELDMVTKALHPESEQQATAVSNGQGLADNHIIDDNIAFNANTFKWSKLRQTVEAKKYSKANDGKAKQHTREEENQALGPIFAILGIRTNIPKAGRERRFLDTRLRAAILGDLVAVRNDQLETMQRMAGYWRYANRRTYNEMVRNNQLWDWATGEKLPEIREETELDVIEEQDEIVEAGTGQTKTEGSVPENWYDASEELATDQTALSLTLLGDSVETNGTVDRIGTPDGGTEPDKGTQSCRSGRLSQILSPSVLSPLSVSGGHAGADRATPLGSPIPESPLSPPPSNPQSPGVTVFQGVKDTRVLGKTLRKASLPGKSVPLSNTTPRPVGKLLSSARAAPDLVNRFGVLEPEIPAPCEEVAEPVPATTPAVGAPAKAVVRTLVVHDERDGWTLSQRPKGKKGTRRSGPVVAAAVTAKAHAKTLAGGKNFTAVAQKGL